MFLDKDLSEEEIDLLDSEFKKYFKEDVSYNVALKKETHSSETKFKSFKSFIDE